MTYYTSIMLPWLFSPSCGLAISLSVSLLTKQVTSSWWRWSCQWSRCGQPWHEWMLAVKSIQIEQPSRKSRYSSGCQPSSKSSWKSWQPSAFGKFCTSKGRPRRGPVGGCPPGGPVGGGRPPRGLGKPQKTSQSHDRLYKAPTDYTKPRKTIERVAININLTSNIKYPIFKQQLLFNIVFLLIKGY